MPTVPPKPDPPQPEPVPVPKAAEQAIVAALTQCIHVLAAGVAGEAGAGPPVAAGAPGPEPAGTTNDHLFDTLHAWVGANYPGQACLDVAITLSGGGKVKLPLPVPRPRPQKDEKR